MKIQNERIISWIAWVWLVGAFFIYVIYMYRHGPSVIDSDNSSEMVLANLLAKENRIVSDNWYYSTELRVLNTQLVFTPLFKILSDWNDIRTVGSAICNLILLLSAWYFVKSLGIRKKFPLIAACLIIPFSTVFFDIVTYGCYYIPHITISFISLTLIFSSIEKSSKKNMIILFILAFFAGLGGLRQLMVLYIPLCCTAVLLFVLNFFKKYDDKIQNRNRKSNNQIILLKNAGGALIFAGIGYIVNTKILSKIYSFFKYDYMSFIDFSLDRFIISINGLIRSIGYKTGSVFSAGVLIQNIVVLILIFFAALSIYENIKKLKAGIIDSKVILTVFFIVSILFFIALYSFTDMLYVDRYNLPIIVFVIPIAFMGSQKLTNKYTLAGYLILIGLLTFTSYKGYYHYKRIDHNADRKELVSVLLKDGYKEGFATFWNGNVLTELSNGLINVRVTGDPANTMDNIKNRSYWLQSKENTTTTPKGKCFILLSKDQLSSTSIDNNMDDKYLIYKSSQEMAWGYDSYNDMLSDLEKNKIESKN